MPYPTIPGRKYNYDVGGCSVYIGNSATDMTGPMTTEQMTRLNGTNNKDNVISVQQYNTQTQRVVWIFFPEKVVISALGMMHRVDNVAGQGIITVHGSADSRNGLDGTWLAANLSNGVVPKIMQNDDSWRTSIQSCTFSESIRVLRVTYNAPYDWADDSWVYVNCLHVYAIKASGESVNDILFMDDDASGEPEFIRDLDFGDRPEGTTTTHRIKIYNSSDTKIANNITVSLVDAHCTLSVDEGVTWVTGFTLTSLAPLTASSSILIKNTIPPPMQTFGPRTMRIEARVGSWT